MENLKDKMVDKISKQSIFKFTIALVIGVIALIIGIAVYWFAPVPTASTRDLGLNFMGFGAVVTIFSFILIQLVKNRAKK